MSRNRAFGIAGILWVVTVALSVLSMLLFALILWPHEDATEEKLARAEIPTQNGNPLPRK